MKFHDEISVFEYLLSNFPDGLQEGLNKISSLSIEIRLKTQQLIDAHIENSKNTFFSDIISSQARLLDIDKHLLNLNGKFISHFKLVKLIGSGGMGVVYLAERHDGQLEQQVAIKIIAPSIAMLTHEEIAFQEAQHLARLNHGNIAKIYDVGTSELGTFIIMQYVEGVPLSEHITPLNLEQRLHLFEKICAAVEYAHQHQVIHADLKPSNILIDANNEPILVDFGIARSTSIAPNSELKTLYIRALSEYFASPEQLAGKQLTTQTDIFSLGRILHHLVSGLSDHELDAIIHKATDFLSTQRFASADSLKQSVALYLARRPLLWYKNSKSYLLKKFIQRAPVTTAFIGTLCLLICIIITSLTVYQNEQKRAAKQQTELLNFYEELLLSSTPSAPQGSKLTVSTLLKSGVKQLEQSEISDANKQIVLLTIAKSLYQHGNYEQSINVLNFFDSSLASQQLLIKNLIALKRQQEAQVLWQSLIEQYPNNVELEALGWLTKINYSEHEQSEIIRTIEKAKPITRYFDLVKHVFRNRDTLAKLNLTLVSLFELPPKSSTSERAWFNLIKSSLMLNQNRQQTKELIDTSLNLAEDSYHPLHSELAELNLLAADLYAQVGYQLEQEQALNKAMYIYQQLAPNFTAELIVVLQQQYAYYFKEFDYLQANNFLLSLLELCSQQNSQACLAGHYQSTQLGLKLRKFQQVLSSAKHWLLHVNVTEPNYFDVVLAKLSAEYELDILSKSWIDKIDIKLLKGKQLETWLDLAIKTNHFNQISKQQMRYLVAQASSSPSLAYQLNLAITKIKNTPHTAWLAALPPSAELEKANTEQFTAASNTPIILKGKRVKAIISPQQNSQLTIGKSYTLKWDTSRLIGNRIFMFVNHTINYKIDSFNDFNNLTTIDWHPIASEVENTGTLVVDPYHFMANGLNRFKILMVSDLGYWSLSDGLFSIASGKSIDNGLEHFLSQDKLVAAVLTPKALDIYPVGKQKSITWNANKLLGKSVSMYVLHDDSRGIGDKQQVNLEVLKNRRWYQYAEELPNTGEFKFDPALFNGRGNNYKVLIVSDLGYWAVSDKRFSVVNPL